MPPSTAQQNAITCPECGNSVVPLGINSYHCINCKFERNFNKPEEKEDKGTIAPVIAVIAAILLLLMV